MKLHCRAGFYFSFGYWNRLIVPPWFLDLLCRWTVWIRRAQFTSQSSAAFINPVYVCLSLNKLSSKASFYKRGTLGICCKWTFPCVPNAKGKWNSTREPAKYTRPLPLVCLTSAWFCWSNPALCRYRRWELWPQTLRAELDQGERRASCGASREIAVGVREVAWPSLERCYPGTSFARASVACTKCMCLWDVKSAVCSESRSMPLLLGIKN